MDAVRNFLRSNVGQLTMVGAVPVLALLGFVIFQPVKVVPRLAEAPVYELQDIYGAPVTDEMLLGRYKLYAFSYTYDPTDTLDRTLLDMQAFLDAVDQQGDAIDILPVLVLFDAERDTPQRRREFAESRELTTERWLLLGGNSDALKRMIGLGFGIYYEQVPLEDLPELDASISIEPGDYGFLQANRYILVGPRNYVRAEYRVPLDLEIAARDLQLLVREENSGGAGKVVNEAAHLFLCYP